MTELTQQDRIIIYIYDSLFDINDDKPLYFITNDKYVYYESPLYVLEFLLGELFRKKGFPKISKNHLQNKISIMMFFLSKLYKVNGVKTDSIKLKSEYIYKDLSDNLSCFKEDTKQFFLNLINIYLNVYYISLDLIFNSELYKDINIEEKEVMSDEWKHMIFYR